MVAGLAPFLLKVIIDELELSDAHGEYVAIFYLIAAYSFAHWLTRSLGEWRGLFYGWTDHRIQRQLSSKLFQHVMSLPLHFHLDRKTGALNQTLTNGLLGYRLLLYHVLLTVIPVIVELMTMGAVLLFLNHAVYLLVIGASVLLYTLTFWVGVIRIRGPARAASNAHIDANASLTDSILNYETIKCFGAESHAQGRFVEALTKTEHRWSELFKCKTQNGLVIAVIFALCLGISVYVAAREVQQGSMSVGDFVLVHAYMLQITQPLEMIGFAFRDIAQGIAFIERMTELFNQRPEAGVIARGQSLPGGLPDLIFKRVSYSYHPDRCVLKSIDFVVPSGKTVAIVGASGSGKSSIIRLLVRLVDPTEGQIYLNDVPLSNVPLSVLRSAVAVVPQDVALFNDSIAYNIGFGKSNSTEADIVRAAKIAHIHDFIVGLPDGYETMVGERGLKLSGGEKQRVAIARAAIRRPKIYVFDEATSSLDSRMERAILHDLIEVAMTATTLIIAHRLSTVVHADEIVMLNQGSVVERGTHSELLQRHGAYTEMWYAQVNELPPPVAVEIARS
jgi:ATP-binding cassette subfamily B protein